MKTKLLLLIVLIPLVFAVPADAKKPGDWIPPGHRYGGEGGAGGSAEANADATAIGVGVGIAVVDNNVRQTQTQDQVQLQGQVQGQQITGSANNEAFNGQTITIEKPDRGLIGAPGYQAPGQLEYRGPYEKGVLKSAKPWDLKKTWTKADMDGMPSCFGDCGNVTVITFRKLEPSEKFEIVAATNMAPVGIILVDGEKGDNPIHNMKDLATYTFKMGGTAVIVADFASSFDNKSAGWNIGLGGGVSATNNGAGNYGGAVGGGTGIGSVTTGPVERTSVAVHVYAK